MSISLNITTPSPIANYDELQSEILDWMDREGIAADVARVPKWILYAESWFNRELRTPEMERTVTFSITDEDTPLPEDYLGMRAIYQETEPDKPLMAMSPDQLRSEYTGQSGIPSAYTIVAGGIRVAPVPETEAIYTLDYFGRIETLSVTAPSNWLLQVAPDLYLFAALHYGYEWANNYEAADRAAQKAVALMDRLQVTSTAARWGAGTRPFTARQIGKGRC